MSKVSVDDMLSGKESRYSLVIGVAKRAREIADKTYNEGLISTEKPVNLAIEDFKQHKYNIIQPDV